MEQRTVERQCTCSNWPQRANDAFFPVWLDVETSEYVLLFGDRVSGALVIYYCPSCGGTMPRSRRGDLFVIPSDEDLHEAKLLLDKISDVATMHLVLGEPDCVYAWPEDNAGQLMANPDAPVFVRQHKYLSRWQTLQVSICEDENGSLRFFFYGPPKRTIR
jgi:hypothetical protein